MKGRTIARIKTAKYATLSLFVNRIIIPDLLCGKQALRFQYQHNYHNEVNERHAKVCTYVLAKESAEYTHN
jgi:hypothetical protein